MLKPCKYQEECDKYVLTITDPESKKEICANKMTKSCAIKHLANEVGREHCNEHITPRSYELVDELINLIKESGTNV